MKLPVLCLAAAAACLNAEARCISNDSWRGPDKVLHFGAGAFAGGMGTLAFKSPHKGFTLGLAAGALKEFYDSRGHGTCSAQDFAYTALGAAAGAYGSAWLVTPRFIGYARVF